MKQIFSLLLCAVFLVTARAFAEDRLIVQQGTYSDAKVPIALVVEELGADQIRFTISYESELKAAGRSRPITRAETHGAAGPLKVETARWAFCIEAPNLVWFYDGKDGLSLWTVTEERGLSRVDSTVAGSAGGPQILRDWIRK